MKLIIGAYSVDVEYVLRKIREYNVRSLLIQSPLGLRGVAVGLAKLLRQEGYYVTLSNSPCWGACDVAYREAEDLGVEAIIHLGHTPFLKRDKIPTIYVACNYHDPSPIISIMPKIIDKLRNFRIIGLGASVQWLDHLELIKQELAKQGIETLTEKPHMLARETAQVLGCDYTSLKPLEEHVEAFLIVGSIFHSLGMALLTEKPTYAVDPVTQEVKELTSMRRTILNQRYAYITRFKEAESVGIVVSIKPGQQRMNIARLIEKLLNNHGKQSYVISADEISEHLMIEHKFDAYVNTACPRLSIEDQVRFPKPFLLPAEVLVALGIIEWEYLIAKGLLMFPWGSTDEHTRLVWQILVKEIRGERVKQI